MKKMFILLLIASIMIFPLATVNSFVLAQKLEKSGIQGTIVYGPVTPVCRVDVPCEKPYVGRVLIKTPDKLKLLKVINTNKNGEFLVILPPGKYYIQTVNKFIRGCSQLVEVEKNSITNINLNCDTGIR